MEETEMMLATQGVQTLAKLEDSPREVTPLEHVEQNLAEFVKHAFEVTENDFNFNRQMQAELASRMGSMENNELIALFNITNQALNDKVSKLIAPTMQATTTHHEAEIAALRQPVNTGTNIQINNMTGSAKDEAVSQAASPEVAAGLDMLAKLLQAVPSLKSEEDGQSKS